MVDQGVRVIAVDGNAVAEEIGDAKVAGVVLVGALSAHLPFADETWKRAIARNVPASWLELNLAAFAAGQRIGAAGVGVGPAARAGVEAAAGAAATVAKTDEGGVHR